MEMTERTVSIELNLAEGNLLLNALAECPFKTVFELIGKLNYQAHLNFGEVSDQSVRRPFDFTEQEMSISIKALEKLPYELVHHLLTRLNAQLAAHNSAESER